MIRNIILIASGLILTQLVGCGASAPTGSNGGNSTASSSAPSGGSTPTPPPPSSTSSGVSQPLPPTNPSPIVQPIPPEGNEPDIGSEATSFYFSYDEAASTASRDLSIYAIQYNGNLSGDWGRPYEFLNAESFSHFAQEDYAPFSVSMGLYQPTENEVAIGQSYDGDLYALGVKVEGPSLTKESRDNVVITLVVDVSGSMADRYSNMVYIASSSDRSLLDVTKRGLLALESSLKEGDVVNLVTFDTYAKLLLSDWHYDATDATYRRLVQSLVSGGTTNLDRGIDAGYDVALATYDPEKSNRVVMLTDALANAGEVDPSRIAENVLIADAEGIHFAGIGIGSSFDDAFLNELTDIGKGTYSAMITPGDADRIMTDGFMRFIDNAVSNVKFRLDYPQSLDQLQTSSEEISEVSDEVDVSHFAYNSSQFFLELFNGTVAGDDVIDLTITYDGDDGEQATTVMSKTVDELLSVSSDEIKASIMVTRLAKLIAGELQCDEVLSSGLYAEVSSHLLFIDYQTLTTQYCARVIRR